MLPKQKSVTLQAVSFMICVMFSFGCEVADDSEDTDTEIVCGEDEVKGEDWCMTVDRVWFASLCSCGDESSCGAMDYHEIFCGIAENHYADIKCINKEVANDCLASLAAAPCTPGDFDYQHYKGCTEFFPVKSDELP